MATDVEKPQRQPNVVFVFGDQWRRQATGFSGNAQVATPNLDRLAEQSIELTHAVIGMPVCSPYRASLLSGKSPLNHGVIINDVPLDPETPSLGKAFKVAGYDTGWIGKWHVDGHGRTNPIPPERRQGFDYWKVLECTHAYNDSRYYDNDETELSQWEGYDAFAQTDDAIDYIRGHANQDHPFALFLSWGPPHNPYQTAPEKYRAMYDPDKIELRPNVPPEHAERARTDLAGYYAHCTALDDALGKLLAAIDEAGLREDTLFVFTSDHGDMLGSQGQQRKQRPYEESVRVPFLLRWPARFGEQPQKNAAMIDAPDLMPTLLGLCGVDCPDTVDGHDFTDALCGGEDPSGGAVLLLMPALFGEWFRQDEAVPYRGVRTHRWTYTRTLEGPWLLYDNEADPYQLKNLVDDSDYQATIVELDQLLDQKLAAIGDTFEPEQVYLDRFGWAVDKHGKTIPVDA